MLDLDLDVTKTHLLAKNEVSRSRLSEVRDKTGQTDRQTRPNVLPRRTRGWYM